MEDVKLALQEVIVPPVVVSKINADIDTIVGCGDHHSKLERLMKNQCIQENPGILDLSGQSLGSLALVLSNQLHTLNICNNEFEKLPDQLCGLVNLSSLAVSQNKLTELPEWIGDLQNLAILKISSNCLQNLPSSFKKLNLLKELDLSSNNFSKIPDSLLVGCISLQNLNLSHNKIESWLLQPASVSTLQSICLSHNLLSYIPTWLYDGKAWSLISLDLSLNPVFYLEQKLSNSSLRSVLRNLSICHCFLSHKDFKFVGQFSRLTHLNLSNNILKRDDRSDNMVREIDISALQCRSTLVQLLVRKAFLTDLPVEIQELVSLEVLDCRNNNLLLLPNSICKLARLQVCLLSSNSLCVLPENFGELTSLMELRLDRNNLTHLPESMKNLQNLRWLDVFGNVINEVPNFMEKIGDNLQGLDFELNYVSLCSDGESIDGHSGMPRDKYESLLKAMRMHFICLGENEVESCLDRANGCRPPDDVNEGNYSDESSHGRHFSDEDSFSERSLAQEDEEEEEVWDTGTSDTDHYFDPNDHISPVTGTNEKPVVIIPDYIVQQHKFCPSDMHMTPTKDNISGIMFTPEDGQFDDA